MSTFKQISIATMLASLVFASSLATIVEASLSGATIDLFTQDWRFPDYSTDFTGLAPAPNGSQVDSYAPQDLVILYAKLAYNGEPICNKEVAFVVNGPPNAYQNLSIYRQAFTNGSGIATINFSISWPDRHAEDIVFGKWWARARANVVGQWIDEMHWWFVHWVCDTMEIRLHNATYTAAEFPKLSCIWVDVTFENWAMEARSTVGTVTVYDEMGVPMGSVIVGNSYAPGVCLIQNLLMFIPEWVRVGNGTVYVNLFTGLPWDSGLPWCPERAVHAYIVAD